MDKVEIRRYKMFHFKHQLNNNKIYKNLNSCISCNESFDIAQIQNDLKDIAIIEHSQRGAHDT